MQEAGRGRGIGKGKEKNRKEEDRKAGIGMGVEGHVGRMEARGRARNRGEQWKNGE